jgi:MFS family permease
MAATLLAIHNGTGSFSRILIGHFGDKMGHMNTLTAGMAITSLAAWTLWLNAAVNQARWAWYVFIAVHGLAGSVFSTLHANVSVQLFGNDVYFAVSGLISCARGVGYAAGSPLAGLIIGEAKTHEKSSKDFKMMIIYISSLLSACTICMITIRAIEASKKGWLWKF